jgi:hypothetical protein
MASPESSAGDAHLGDGGGGSDGPTVMHNDAGDDAGGFDAPADGACTPLTSGDFFCGSVMCNGVTSYCLHGYMGQMCVPMPSECQCAETRGCSCLLANADPCDAGPFTCSTVLFDGGLVFLQALNCP